MYLDFTRNLIEVLEGAENCIIIPHKNPDDALGSSMALYLFLIKLEKKKSYIAELSS